MFLAEVVPPAGPVTLPALAALFALCALIVAIGMVKLVDAISRAFFGTISGAVGWIPFAGKVVAHSLHKVEQKISHMLGTAERKLDGWVALTWHTLAHVVAMVGQEIQGAAETTWRLAQQAKAFVHRREVTHEIRGAVKPVKAQQSTMRHDLHNLSSEQRALHKSVAQGVYPRLKAGEVYDRTVARPAIRTARAEAKAAEDQAIATYKWLVKHRLSVLTGVFTGAVAFALSRLGGGWIRCANWRKIGKTVCRMPMSEIDNLLGLLALAFALASLREIAAFAESVTEEAARGVAELLSIGDLPHGQFTIE